MVMFDLCPLLYTKLINCFYNNISIVSVNVSAPIFIVYCAIPFTERHAGMKTRIYNIIYSLARIYLYIIYYN